MKNKIILYILPFLLFFACSYHSNILLEENERYNFFSQAPNFVKPKKEKWRHLRSHLIRKAGSPYHMAHDLIIRENKKAIMVAKFDYGKVLHKDLQDEKVYVAIYGSLYQDWKYLGWYFTNSDGKIYINIPPLKAGKYIVKMIVVGDLSETFGYITVVGKRQNAIVFDIDGTLTLNDFEAVEEYVGIDKADPYQYAKEVVRFYYVRGYEIIYVTGRPYWLAKATRFWLDNEGFPTGILRITKRNKDSLPGKNTLIYKYRSLREFSKNNKIKIIAAYGNAKTDIAAYNKLGISKKQTYIIGKYAGYNQTTGLQGNYKKHYSFLQENFEK